jgi:hypothetical protein
MCVRRGIASTVDEIMWVIKFSALVHTICNVVLGNIWGFIQTVTWSNKEFLNTVINVWLS